MILTPTPVVIVPLTKSVRWLMAVLHVPVPMDSTFIRSPKSVEEILATPRLLPPALIPKFARRLPSETGAVLAQLIWDGEIRLPEYAVCVFLFRLI